MNNPLALRALSNFIQLRKLHCCHLEYLAHLNKACVFLSSNMLSDQVNVKFVWPGEAKSGFESTIYRDCSCDLGTLICVVSSTTTSKGYLVMPNENLIPPRDNKDSEAQDCFTRLWNLKRSSSLPEDRTLSVTLTSGKAQSLEECTSAWDLVESVMHAQLCK